MSRHLVDNIPTFARAREELKDGGDPDEQLIASEIVDLSKVTFVVSVKGGKLVLRPEQPNPLLVAWMAAQPVFNTRAVLITSTCPGGDVEDMMTTHRRWCELVDTTHGEVVHHAKSYPGCGGRKSEDHLFVLGMDRVRADNLAKRWHQVCYLDIDLNARRDGRPILVYV